MSETFLPWVLDEWLFNNSYDVILAWCFFTPHCSAALAFTRLDQVYDHKRTDKSGEGMCLSRAQWTVYFYSVQNGICINITRRYYSHWKMLDIKMY